MFGIGDRVEIIRGKHAGEVGIVTGNPVKHGSTFLQAVRRKGTEDVLMLLPNVEFTN